MPATQFVLTGQADAVAAALGELAPRALNVLPLAMSWPIHSELMRPVAEAIAPVVAACDSIRAPRVPYSAPTARRVETAEQRPRDPRHRVLPPDALERERSSA